VRSSALGKIEHTALEPERRDRVHTLSAREACVALAHCKLACTMGALEWLRVIEYIHA
jgi:formate hydrogenlyase subunit 6/NADH:ubiquinone oxidoreductase subunit I